MKEIPLTRGCVAIVDDADYDWVSQFKWCAYTSTNDHTFYAHRRIKKEPGKSGHISMHRFLLGDPTGMEVDHIDGNGLNNIRSNLRLCTHAQNMSNQRISNKHGYKGIVLIDRRRFKPWMVKVCCRGKSKTVGYFDTAEEAALAYNRAAIERFGQFARLNQIGEPYLCARPNCRINNHDVFS